MNSIYLSQVVREIGVQGRHAVSTVTWPGALMVMTPPHMQLHVHSLVRAGMLPMRTVGEPGVHGVIVAGTQGCGVSTPSAAAVAAATWGLLGDEQIPKDAMLTIGWKS